MGFLAINALNCPMRLFIIKSDTFFNMKSKQRFVYDQFAKIMLITADYLNYVYVIGIYISHLVKVIWSIGVK